MATTTKTPKSTKNSKSKTTKQAPTQKLEDSVKKTKKPAAKKPAKQKLEDLMDDCRCCGKEKHLSQLFTFGCYWNEKNQNYTYGLICDECLKTPENKKKYEGSDPECWEDMYLKLNFRKYKDRDTMRSINMSIAKHTHIKELDKLVDEVGAQRERDYSWWD